MKRIDPELAWYGGYWEPAPDPPKTWTQPPDDKHRSDDRASKDPAVLKRVGVVMGRFRPPHRGHGHLVDEAFAQCGLLYLISPYPSSGAGHALHQTMIDRAFSDKAEINVVSPPSAAPDPLSWVDIVKDVAPHATHMFSSDTRAEGLAAKLGLTHVLVDPDRSVHHVCARDIRTDVFGLFRWILPRARPLLGLTIGLVGPESAGKTTLAHELEAELGAVVVEDKLRMDAGGHGQFVPERNHFAQIVSALHSLERQALTQSDAGIVVLDCSIVQASAWIHRMKIKGVPIPVEREQVDLWLLCHDDFGFVGPPDRDQPDARREMLQFLRDHLRGQRVVEIRGGGTERVDTAVEAIRQLMHERQLQYQQVLGG